MLPMHPPPDVGPAA